MRKTFSIMPDLLFQALAPADIKNRDGKEDDGYCNENEVLHRKLLDNAIGISECPFDFCEIASK
jgi:hypothetical protein